MRRLTLLTLLMLAAGCQAAVAPQTEFRTSAVAPAEVSGLAEPVEDPNLAATVRAPVGWDVRPLQKRPFARHQQFRNDDGSVRVGVVKFVLPLPLSAQMLVQLGNGRYQSTKPSYSKDGVPERNYTLGDIWPDALGRLWITGDTPKWHASGYLICKGFSGWLVYGSHRTDRDVPEADLQRARDVINGIVPHVGGDD